MAKWRDAPEMALGLAAVPGRARRKSPDKERIAARVEAALGAESRERVPHVMLVNPGFFMLQEMRAKNVGKAQAAKRRKVSG